VVNGWAHAKGLPPMLLAVPPTPRHFP
jgi:hypothetical protein